jgi:hypothetical protein
LHAPGGGLYVRCSKDQQNPTSIETQLDLRKEFILRQSRHLADTFVDAGVSGSSFETRPGLQAALAKSNGGAHAVFLHLTFDRLSRDLEHSARILKILQFHDFDLWTVHVPPRCHQPHMSIHTLENLCRNNLAYRQRPPVIVHAFDRVDHCPENCGFRNRARLAKAFQRCAFNALKGRSPPSDRAIASAGIHGIVESTP